jgi:predicted phosphodiesterase
MMKLCTLWAILLFIGVDPADGQTSITHIRFGSTGDPLNGLTIAWNGLGTEDKIAWGYTTFLEGGDFVAKKSYSITGTRFEFTFPSLAAGISIYYKIFDSKNSVWTKLQSFKTASDASGNQFSFTVLGDSRTNPDEWQIISEAIQDTDFTLFMGDIVNDGKDAPDWQDWFDFGERFISREVVYHCVGNHDDDDSPSGFDNFLGLFTQPGNELYYSFTYGNALFICLNSENPDDYEQNEWLLSTLEANKDKLWKILFFHKPYYTAPSHTGEMDAFFYSWWEAFDNYGVDMIFNGHTHNYQRTKPINRNVSTTSAVDKYGSEPGEGRCQIVAGNAGAPLSSAASSSLWWLEKSVSARHFCNIDIDGNKLTMKAMNASQNVIDQLVLEKAITGTNRIKNNSSTIFPNPSNGAFSVTAAGYEILGYRIFDSTGRIISENLDRRIVSGQVRIDMRDQAEGIYFIEIRTGAGTSLEKIMISN